MVRAHLSSKENIDAKYTIHTAPGRPLHNCLNIPTVADILELKWHGRWKSSTIAEAYLKQPVTNKLNVAKKYFTLKKMAIYTYPSTNTYVSHESRSRNEQYFIFRNINVENWTNCPISFNNNNANKLRAK